MGRARLPPHAHRANPGPLPLRPRKLGNRQYIRQRLSPAIRPITLERPAPPRGAHRPNPRVFPPKRGTAAIGKRTHRRRPNIPTRRRIAPPHRRNPTTPKRPPPHRRANRRIRNQRHPEKRGPAIPHRHHPPPRGHRIHPIARPAGNIPPQPHIPSGQHPPAPRPNPGRPRVYRAAKPNSSATCRPS